MKKILIAVLFLCIVCIASVHAQRPGDRMIVSELSKSYAKQQSALSKQVEQQIQQAAQQLFPIIKLGKHPFVLRQSVAERLGDGQTVWTYVYVPKKLPVVYRERVVTDDITGESKVMSWPGLLSILKWEYADYEISEIEITIYPDNRLVSLAEQWKETLGEACVRVLPVSRLARVVNMLHTPTRAMLTGDNRTMVISVNASSKKYGPYQGVCHANTFAGRIFIPFLNMTSQLEAKQFPQVEYSR